MRGKLGVMLIGAVMACARGYRSGTPRPGATDTARARDADGASSHVGMPYHGRSQGCGKLEKGTGHYAAGAIRAATERRTYSFYTPKDYDPARAYPLVFKFHGYGGDGQSGGLEIEDETDSGALVIAPDGMLEPDRTARHWSASTEALDLALFDELLSWASAAYCVDLDRVYAYGFSAGGGMAQLLACKRGHAIRAIGTVEALNRTEGATCEGRAAAFLLHDIHDSAVPIAGAIRARDHLREQDGCTMESDPAGAGCVRYRGCAPGEPVVWCVTADDAGLAHTPRGAAAAKPIWQFFSSLPAQR